jgi:hypothetical protein
MDTIVVVEWADAHQSSTQWTHIGDIDTEGERIVRTVGFLISASDGGKEDHITIVQSWDRQEEMIDNVMHIPVCMVKRMSAVVFEIVDGVLVSR